MIKVEFSASRRFPPSLKRAICRAALTTCDKLPKVVRHRQLDRKSSYKVIVSIVGPKAIQRLNRQYRRKDKATDVLSFPRLKSSFPFVPGATKEIGDVLICLDVAKHQAKTFSVTLQEELERLTVHGVLHLFGYDHEISAKEERRMFRLQEKILRGL